jgi:glyoxylase-like metal-dependent hydrolase (beta-lactamase superfamily II)
MILKTLPVGMLQVNCYILGSEATREAIVVDPGDNASGILAALRGHELKLGRIVATHAHFDHLLGCRELQESTSAAFLLHEADMPLLAAMQRTCQAWLGYDPGPPPKVTEFLVPGKDVETGGIRLEVRHTPGHSPGSVTLVDHTSGRAFTGDALFAGSIGRTDFPGGNLETLLESIRSEILTLPDDYAVLSGHGESSTVGVERRTNPFLSDAGW